MPDGSSGFRARLLRSRGAHGVALVGGDTTAGPLTVSVQILGHVPRGTALRRGGARAGRSVGGDRDPRRCGRRSCARDAQRSRPQDLAAARELVRRFEYPAPRVEFGLAARGIATAAMDLSDGLAGDLPKLAAASGLAAHVEIERLPLSQALRPAADPQQARDWALGAGDDYELLLAVPPRRYAELAARPRPIELKIDRDR